MNHLKSHGVKISVSAGINLSWPLQSQRYPAPLIVAAADLASDAVSASAGVQIAQARASVRAPI